ncbi:hypothetical protein CRUP_037969 [Coryphaenoides rupestris]|nr:hypothetical protein CRUP_037969 [Coryphaenoides rupestris]
MAANMYRVGDYVFFENSSSNPYLIRRIEELNKTASGNVEAKVVCFYRRRDISHSLIQLADKHAKDLEEEKETPTETDLSEKQKHQLRHRELFLSRQYESLPATHIRGKCSVALLNETEAVLSYLDKEDTFFYSLVYDPTQKTLLADKGEIRVGPRFQADVPDMLQEGEPDDREQSKLEEKLWDPECPLSSKQIDQFLVVARFHAMDTLHRHGYDLSSALSVLVPAGGPVLCRDEMEEWSASEAAINKPNPNQISMTNGKMATVNGAGPGAYHTAGGGRACESCYSKKACPGLSTGRMRTTEFTTPCRLCVSCWMYWKKYGGLKMPSRAEVPEEPTSPLPLSNVSAHHVSPRPLTPALAPGALNNRPCCRPKTPAIRDGL